MRRGKCEVEGQSPIRKIREIAGIMFCSLCHAVGRFIAKDKKSYSKDVDTKEGAKDEEKHWRDEP